LWVTPTAKLWNLAYRFNRKQLKLSIGPYPEVTLAAARTKRDAAKAQISQGIDPNQAKKEAKRQLADAKTFADWADDWIAKEKLKWDVKTMAGKERYVGYLKGEFGDRTVPKIARRDVLTFLKAFEADEKLETRDRTRATGEKICLYADQDGTDYNPFRNLSEQLVDNDSTPRPALTDPVKVVKLFQDVAKPFERARFNDIVGLAVRFTSLTAARPGNIADAEWTEFNNVGLWTVSAEKMKMDKEHIVPLSRQALAILEQVALLTGGRKYVFSCSRDQPISDNTLNKRLRDLGYNTAKDHCAHGFRTTFSTLLNGECDRDGNKTWDGDVIELQLAHLDSSSVRAVYNRTGPMSLMGARAKLMQHWADRVDALVGDNVMPIGVRRIGA
jgi:integrase